MNGRGGLGASRQRLRSTRIGQRVEPRGSHLRPSRVVNASEQYSVHRPTSKEMRSGPTGAPRVGHERSELRRCSLDLAFTHYLGSSPCHEKAAPCKAPRIVLRDQARRVEAAQHFVGREEPELVHLTGVSHSVGTGYFIVKPEP